MKKFYKFVESNDMEGETWVFFVPMTDEEHAIVTRRLVELADGLIDDPYELYDDPIDESEVDIVCRHAIGGYHRSHSKMYGVDLTAVLESKGDDDPFYKGACWLRKH